MLVSQLRFRSISATACFVLLASCNNQGGSTAQPCKVINNTLTQKDAPKTTDATGATNGFSIVSGSYKTPSQYLVNFKIGGQTINAVADTGSSNIVVQGDKSICPTCTNASYSPGASAVKGQKGPFSLGYGSGNGQALEYTDSVGLGCGPNVKMAFGVLTTNENLPDIIGFAYENILAQSQDGNITSTFMEQMVKATGMENAFGMLLCGKQNGSLLSLGLDRTLIPADMNFISITAENYYEINTIKTVQVGNNAPIAWPKTGSAPARTILDSGTTLTTFPEEVYTQVLSQIQAAVAGTIPNSDAWWTTITPGPNYSKKLDDATIAKFPNVTLTHFGDKNAADVNLVLPARTYLKDMGTNDRIFGFRKQDTGFAILGQTVMENYYVLFDRAQKRIGFSLSAKKCS